MASTSLADGRSDPFTEPFHGPVYSSARFQVESIPLRIIMDGDTTSFARPDQQSSDTRSFSLAFPVFKLLPFALHSKNFLDYKDA